jgi:MFS family permease
MFMKRREKILDTGPRICFFVQTAFGTAFSYLTSGVFLSGLALLMGAGDVLVSYLSVIVNICGVLILGFAAYLERFQSRKRLTVIFTALSRTATLFIVLIPAVVPKRMQIAVFVLAVVMAFTLQAQTTVVLNQWMMGFMDEKKSGRYISLRQTLTLGVTVLLSVAGGFWMDHMQGEYLGFAVLFGAAAVMSICEVMLLMRTPDSAPYRPLKINCGLGDALKIPLKDRKFVGFVVYILAFYLLLNISDSFTMVYMMKYLALPYKTVTAMYMIISLPQIVLLGLWGRISDKRGHEFVLKTSIWLFAGETLFMSFAAPKNCLLFIPAAFLISSVANAGFVVAVFNRRYELMPKDNRIMYDNFYTAVIGLGFILGPMIGGAVKGFLEAGAAVKSTAAINGIHCLYLISTAGILLLQVIYYRVQGRREVCVHVKG